MPCGLDITWLVGTRGDPVNRSYRDAGMRG